MTKCTRCGKIKSTMANFIEGLCANCYTFAFMPELAKKPNDQISLRCSREFADRIRERAKALGMSINTYLICVLEKEMK